MSGLLARNFRGGNLSEILADYLLSSIGIATSVKRQDDFGFDFYCQLSDQEDGEILTFSHPYIIQIKSDSKSILYGNKDPEKWRQENMAWLFKLEWPFFIGIVNKEEISIAIYRTTNLWFLFYEHPNCSQIELSFRNIVADELNKRPEVTQLKKWKSGQGDGAKYTVLLGNPIVTFNDKDLENIDLIRKKKQVLRQHIDFEMNITYKRLGVKHFSWIPEHTTNEPFYKFNVMHYRLLGDQIAHNIVETAKPSLLALLSQYHEHRQLPQLAALKEYLKLLPGQELFKQFKKQNPELFDWVED